MSTTRNYGTMEEEGSNENIGDGELESLLAKNEILDNLPLRSILLMTCGIGGTQMIWSTIFSNGTIYLQSIGVPRVLTALLWSVPPFCGCFVQPLVGARSDRCAHPWGRRRPFIAVGSLGTIVSILGLAWAGSVGAMLASLLFPVGSTTATQITIDLCAALSVCALSLSVQPLQCGLRALVLDLCPPHQQVQAQSWSARFSSTGQILGCAAGLLMHPGASPLGGTYTFRMLAFAAVLAVSASAAITCLGVHDPPLRVACQDSAQSAPREGTIASLRRTFYSCTPLLRRVLAIQFVAWMGWFTFLYYNTSYLNSLYLQTSTAPDARLSGYIASFVSLAFACISFATTAFLPALVHHLRACLSPVRVSRKPKEVNIPTLLSLWSGGLCLSALLMFSTLYSTDFDTAVVLMALNGIPWAMSNWIPYALIGKLTAEHGSGPDDADNGRSAGSIVSLNNIAISAPQMLAACISGGILGLTQVCGLQYGAGWVLRAGGIAYFAAAVLTCSASRRFTAEGLHR